MKKLMKIETKFGSVTSKTCLLDLMHSVEHKTISIIDDENVVPMEKTLFKFFKNLPIHLILISEETEYNKPKYTVVKGGSDLKNLMKWVNENPTVTINEIDVSYESFNKKEKDFLMTFKYGLIQTVIDQNCVNKSERLNTDEFIEVIKEYY